MALATWKNDSDQWETIEGETGLANITSFHMIADVIISNTEIEHLIQNLLGAYMKNDTLIYYANFGIDKMSYGEKTERLSYIIKHLEDSDINRYLLDFLKDVSRANKFRVRAAHRNIFRELLKDSYINHLKNSRNSDLLKDRQFMDDSGLNTRDNKAQIHSIFKSYNAFIEKYLVLIGLLEQDLADEIARESLGISKDSTIGRVLLSTKPKTAINIDGYIEDIESISKWSAPPLQKPPDAKILTMPNIPRPLNGDGLQPRTILSREKWDMMRKKCYEAAQYRCQACGRDLQPSGTTAQAHEMFSINYELCESTFERLVCLCDKCHKFIHSGRLITNAKKGDLKSKEDVLNIIEHGFKIINNYVINSGDKIRVYSTIASNTRDYEIGAAIQELINKYDIAFYTPIKSKKQSWSNWHMIYDGKKYYTPYANESEYLEAMKLQRKIPADHSEKYYV